MNELVFKGQNDQILANSISIRNYKKIRRDESKLEIAERNHFLDKIYTIISNLIIEYKAA